VEVESNHWEKTLTIKRYEQVTYEVLNANDEVQDEVFNLLQMTLLDARAHVFVEKRRSPEGRSLSGGVLLGIESQHPVS
jgi:hypothetical protein